MINDALIRMPRRELIFLLSLWLVVITMPISGSIHSASIILLGLVWIFQQHFKNIKRVLNVRFLASFLFYILFVVGLFYTIDMKNGLFQLEQKISLFAFPLIFSTVPEMRQGSLKIVFSSFVVVCFIAGLYCLSAGFIANYRSNGLSHFDVQYFTNQDLASYIGAHSTYLSIYVAFSAMVIIEELRQHKITALRKFFYVGMVMFFVLFLFLLSSRIVILTFLMLFAVTLVRAVFREKLNKVLVAASALALIIVAITFSQSDYFKNRFSQIYNFNTSDLVGSDNENGVSQRVFFWKNAVKVIGSSPLYGHGTGDADIEMKRQYEVLLSENPQAPESVVKAVHYFIEHHYNAHNQYLQVLILFGFLGLSVFLFMILNAYYTAFQHKDLLHASFLTIIFFACLTECVLDRQAGVIFYAFFNSIFLFRSANEFRS